VADGFEIDTTAVRNYADGDVQSRIDRLLAAAQEIQGARVQPDVPFLIADVGPKVEQAVNAYAEAVTMAAQGQQLHQQRLNRSAQDHDSGEDTTTGAVRGLDING
jgi:hypothetical protein